MEVLETEKLIRMLVEKVLKEISEMRKTDSEKIGESEKTGITVKTAFLGNDGILKAELKKYIAIEDYIEINSTWEEVTGNCASKIIKILVVSELCINNLIDVVQGRKNIITEYLLNGVEAFVVEEGLEYRAYKHSPNLIKIYDEYFEKIKKFGIKFVKKGEINKILAVREDFRIQGVITAEKLRNSDVKDRKIVVGRENIITSAAKDYIKENGIEIYYERGQ